MILNTKQLIEALSGKNKSFISRVAKTQEEKYGNVDIFECIIRSEDDIEISYGDYQYGLRPYIYYSCRYKYGTSDFIVNYTLDNTITVYGTINGSYTTKSGALIKPDSVNESTIQLGNYSYRDSTNNLHTVEYAKYIEYDGISINMEVLQEQLIILDDNNFPSMNTYEYTNYSNRRIYMDESGYFWNRLRLGPF